MLLLCREIIGVACKDLTQHTSTLCGKSADFSRFAAVVYLYHASSKSYVLNR